MSELRGITKIGRERIESVLNEITGVFSVSDVSKILGCSQHEAAVSLARWANNGWFSRVKRGKYVAVPLGSSPDSVIMEDPWIIVTKIYTPCYISKFSAVNYWGLTEQIFLTTFVTTTREVRERDLNIKGQRIKLTTTKPEAMFGLEVLWKDGDKIYISDPTRTLLDLLSDPKSVGGITFVADVFEEYMRSEHKNVKLLVEYGDKLRNGAVFKRLGFLLERFFPNEKEKIEDCRIRITKGNSKLDPQLKADVLVTKWRLWIPKSWKELKLK